VKRTGRDEPTGVVIHMCMETTQGNSLCSSLYLKVAKMPCFCYYPLHFFFYKIGEQEGRTGSAQWGWGLALVGGRRQWGKGVRGEYGAKNVYTSLCTQDTC
jgi:hypothetical protein